MKRKTKKYLPIVLIIGILALFGGLFSVSYDDYNMYDDFDLPTVDETKWTVSQTNCQISVSEGTVYFGGGSSKAPCSFTLSTKDLKGYDFKTEYSIDSQGTKHEGSEASLHIQIEGVNACTLSGSGNTRVQATSNAELTQNRANQNIYNVACGGFEKELDIQADNEVLLSYVGYVKYGTVSINYLKTRPFFSCEVLEGQVLVRKEFGSGILTYDKLKPKPERFCKDFPVLIQEVGTGITSDKRGDLVTQIANNVVPIIIPEGKTYVFSYIARYQEGMPQCKIGEFINLNTNKCEQYAVEKEEVITPINQVNKQNVGKNEVTFTNNGYIGDLAISSQAPKFICVDSGIFNAPNPKEGCWQIPITSGSDALNPLYGTEFTLKPNVIGKAYTEATVENGILRGNKFTNTIIITIKDLFSVVSVPDESYSTLQNSDSSLSLSIDNKIANFNDAGVKVVIDNKLLNQEEIKFISFPIKLGKNTYKVPKDTSQLGQFTYTITPFATINNVKMYDDQTLTYSFEVVQTQQEVQQKQCGFWCNIWNKIKSIFR